MPALPRHYNKRLQRVYPQLRVRWSPHREEWRLEQKCNYARVDINPANYPAQAIDTFIMRRDGYFLAGRYEPERLPPVDLLIAILRANDTTRMDLPGATSEARAAAYMEKVEERENAAEAKLKKDNTFEHSGAGGELYDRLAWEEGRRVAVPRTLPTEA